MDLGYHMAVRYYGPSGSFRRISAAEVLRGDLHPEFVRGQVVVVGVTATGMGDTFATPFDRVSPGAEIFATAISNLLNGDALVRTPSTRRIDAAATVGLPAVTIALMAMRRPAIGFAIAGFVFVLWAAGSSRVRQRLSAEHRWGLASTAPLALGYASLGRLSNDRQPEGSPPRRPCWPSFSPLFRRSTISFASLGSFRSLFARTSRSYSWICRVHPRRGGAGAGKRSRDILGGMQTMVEREVTSERGIVINFMGDGVLAVLWAAETARRRRRAGLDRGRAPPCIGPELARRLASWQQRAALIFASALISARRSFRGTDRRAISRSAPRATQSTSQAGSWKWRSSSIVASSSPKICSRPRALRITIRKRQSRVVLPGDRFDLRPNESPAGSHAQLKSDSVGR